MTNTKDTGTDWFYQEVEFSDGKHFTVFTSPDTGFGVQDEKTASFIVRAANGHQKLIGLIQAVVEAHTEGDFYDRGRKVHDLIGALTQGLIEVGAIPNASEEMEKALQEGAA